MSVETAAYREEQRWRPEIHYTRIYRAFKRFETHRCFDAIFIGSVSLQHPREYLDISVIHGDGTTTVALKGGDNLGFSGHKHMKGDKVVAFCDRRCNVIAPFIAAPGNRHESPLLLKALPQVTHIAKHVGLCLANVKIWSVRTSLALNQTKFQGVQAMSDTIARSI